MHNSFHLFQIEQQFSEELLLQSEIHANLYHIQEVSSSKREFKFEIDGHTTQIRLSNDLQQVQKMHCSCDLFKNQEECNHLIVSLWNIRKRMGAKDLPEASNKKRKIKSSSLIDEIDDQSLRQFLVGFSRHNDEFNLLLKLFFQHLISDNHGIEKVEAQLNQMLRSYRNRLDTKKHSNIFFFHLKSFIGVAEDLLAQRHYQPAVYNSLALFHFWNEHFRTLRSSKAYENLYIMILDLFEKTERADISPELYTLLISTTESFISRTSYIPIEEYDLPEQLVSWNHWSESDYLDWLSAHLTQSFCSAYFTRALKEWTRLKEEDRRFVDYKTKEWSMERLIKELQSCGKIDAQALIDIVYHDMRWTEFDVQQVSNTLISSQAYVIDFLVWFKGKSVQKGRSFLAQASNSKEISDHIKELMRQYSFPAWMRAAIDSDLVLAFDTTEEERIKAELLSFPYYTSGVRKEKRNQIVEHILAYAENHFGSKAREFLQEVKSISYQIQSPEIWQMIEEQLQSKHAHRKSLMAIFN